MTNLLDGKTAAAAIRAELAGAVRDLMAAGRRTPGLAAVLVGEDPASQVYVGSKIKGCAEVGMESRTIRLPATTTEAELLALVDELNRDEAMDGILVQLPLPSGVNERRVLDRVDPDKDVDGFHPTSVGRLWLDQPGFVPATPSGILELLRRNRIPMAGRRAVVVGRSAIVGKPMAALLLRENCTVTIAHSRTKNLPDVVRRADLVVAAIGKPEFVKGDWIKPGAIVIDVGINRIVKPDGKGKLVGDVAFAEAAQVAGAITPVPGGVGPMTIACLLKNTVEAAQMQRGIAAAA